MVDGTSILQNVDAGGQKGLLHALGKHVMDKDPVAQLTVHVPRGTVLPNAHFGQGGGKALLVAIGKSATFVATRAGKICAKGPAPIRPADPNDKGAVNESRSENHSPQRPPCHLRRRLPEQRVIISSWCSWSDRAALSPPVFRERRQKAVQIGRQGRPRPGLHCTRTDPPSRRDRP
jgi:hypothetical protein